MKQTAIVIIPTYNERENIVQTITALEAVFTTISHWNMEILIVDDTSPDKTYEVVQAIAQKNSRLHLLLNKQKSGLGGAYLKGMAYAFGELKADVVFEFDADLSHDPSKIPLILQKIEEGFDLVLGSRYVPGGGIPHDWGLHRKLLSRVGNLTIMVVLTNFKIHDWTAGYRAITRRVYDKVQPLMTSRRFNGYTFQVGFLYNTVRYGFSVAEVPYVFKDRTLGKSKIGPEYLKNTLAYICKVRAQEIYHHRIFRFAVVGGIGAVVQLSSFTILVKLLPQLFAGLISLSSAELLAGLISIELAIFSNFVMNNFWTFSDRKLQLSTMPIKFFVMNVTSAGSMLIQMLVLLIAQKTIGLNVEISLLILPITITSGQVFVVVGILLGMIWNFFAYNTFIWKKKST